MSTKNSENGNSTSITAFLMGSIGLIGVIVFDKFYWGTSLLGEGWPKFSADYLIRSLMISIFTFAMLRSLIGSSRPKFVLDEENAIHLERLSILVTTSISVAFLLTFIFNPSSFNTLSIEDGFIESASAILLFGCCIISAISLSKIYNDSGFPRGTQLSIAILTVIFFVMTMEEISWFQRILEIETPKLFQGNHQKELNLHNFFTNTIENIYYFSAFIFLVVLPYVRFIFPFVSNNNYLKIFLARPFIGVIGSIACVYNFDMWNIIFTQITFFGSLAILFSFFLFSSNKRDKYIVLILVFISIGTQLLFLGSGEKFSRQWEVTEYKEFFIPLAFFIYSLDMFIFITKSQVVQKKLTKKVGRGS